MEGEKENSWNNIIYVDLGLEGSIVVFLVVGEKFISLIYFLFLIDVIIIFVKINLWILRYDNLCDLFYLRKENLEFKI